jgi:hypothetical protein
MRILLLSLLLMGCSTTVPITAKFPDAPGIQATSRCPNLRQLEDVAQLSDIAKTITVNYTEYYQCAVKLDAWIEWYQVQKHIFEEIK